MKSKRTLFEKFMSLVSFLLTLKLRRAEMANKYDKERKKKEYEEYSVLLRALRVSPFAKASRAGRTIVRRNSA